MSASSPTRPRLADHVLARRHRVDGGERVVLHDLHTGRLVQIGAREWGLLAAADGSRDVDGILLAAAREGAHARAPTLRSFLEQLQQAGLLAEGTPAEEDTTAKLSPPDRPLSLLPDFSLHCDGSGSCCRIYASVLFAPVEAAGARAFLPQILDGGARHERIFLPERGSAPCAGSAVTLIDGRCAYLAASGRCSLHEKGGEAAKPVGCSLFPASFVDDGETIRVSVRVECTCVLESAGRPGGSPLIDPAARIRGDLDEAVHVAALPESVAISGGDHAERTVFRHLSNDLLASPPCPDPARALWSLARGLEARGLDDPASRRLDPSAPPLDPSELRPWIEALSARARRRSSEDEVWRSKADLARIATRAIAAAATSLLDPGALPDLLARPPTSPADEAFYLRAALHGHQLVCDLPFVQALRDRAIRLLVARALPSQFAALGVSDSATRKPLALLEAMLRGHGLDAYAHDPPQ